MILKAFWVDLVPVYFSGKSSAFVDLDTWFLQQKSNCNSQASRDHWQVKGNVVVYQNNGNHASYHIQKVVASIL